ncbi:uncharacterized protein EAE97_002817 [Botrytis byssoidea]|uniref:Uncharacterized protein n=1 Tax=Botrytis byssoidea TaxID=139641 RepID=A0A9P5M4M9_9HELO|nr:uncharacterized protein EAE97_002817 [Botrytis byssoidea]KAF7949308.1 hypothetical protein EAE97_002817 [Botrytis byssoidea]
MYTLVTAALAFAEHGEEQNIKREKNQSSEEKQKQQTARGRLAQIAKTLPKKDKETAGTELDMKRLVDEGLLARLRSGYSGDREQGVESLKTVRWEGGVGEGILSRRRSNYTSDREQRVESLMTVRGDGESEVAMEEGREEGEEEEGIDGVCKEESEGEVERGMK